MHRKERKQRTKESKKARKPDRQIEKDVCESKKGEGGGGA
jgi:hypothetical protein